MPAALPRLSLRASATLLTLCVACVLAAAAVLLVRSNLEHSYANTAGLLAAARARTGGDALGTEIADVTAHLQAVASAIEQFGVSSDPQQLQAWLDSIQQSKSEYAWIGIADGTGRVVVGTHGQKVGIDESQSAWFKSGRAALYYGGLRDSTLLKQQLAPLPKDEPWRFVDVAMPLSAGTSASGGVLVVHLSWPWLRERLLARDSAFPADSELWLLGPDNQPWLGRDSQVSKPLSVSAVGWARQGKAGWTVETWPDGHSYITGYSPVTSSSTAQGVHWVTLVRRRADVWPLPIQHEFAAVALLASTFVVLATGFVWIASTFWLRPLRRFALRIGQTRDGERPPRAPANLPQEFYWLNDAIVGLVDRLNAKEAAMQRDLAQVRYSFRAVGASIPGVLASFRLTPAGKLQLSDVSDSCEHYCGVPAQALLSDPMNWTKNADSADVQALKRAFSRMLRHTDHVLTAPVRFTGADGEQRTLQVTIIQREQSDERTFDSISLDITELLRARREAEHAGRAKSEFLGSMSHELRTPLNAILGLSRALEDGATEPEQRRQARYVRESTETLSRTLSDLLDVAKMNAGTFDLEPRRFSLREVIESSAEIFRLVAAGRSLAFRVEAPDHAPDLIGDPVRLRQIVHELLSNAFKFTATGQVSVCVKITGVEERLCDAKRQAHLRISVADTGVGMTAEDTRSAFEHFHQVERSTGAPAGTGLGLAIVKWLVDKMRGTISVKSTYGRGTEFTALIPFEVASTATPAATALPAGAFEPSLTVLVADDYDINRHVLRALLEQRGHRVLEAEDGVKAMEIASRMCPDVVLMDVDMPHLDGLESTRRIRAMGGFAATVPIYALTGRAFPEDIERVSASGMNGHLSKPVELHDLVAVLRLARETALRDPGHLPTCAATPSVQDGISRTLYSGAQRS